MTAQAGQPGGAASGDLEDGAREVAAGLAATGEVEVRQRGGGVDPATATGPLRYGRGTTFRQLDGVGKGNSPILDG